jgi:acyl carrier protein
MEINNFVSNVAAQFEDIDADTLKPESKLRDIEGWSSLIALSIIAMVEEEYNVKVKGDDIKNMQTIEDLFKLVQKRI